MREVIIYKDELIEFYTKLAGSDSKILGYYWIRRVKDKFNMSTIQALQIFSQIRYSVSIPHCKLGNFTLVTPFRVLYNLRILSRLEKLSDNMRYELQVIPYKTNKYILSLIDRETHVVVSYKLKLFSVNIDSPIIDWLMYFTLSPKDKVAYKIQVLTEKQSMMKSEQTSFVHTKVNQARDIKKSIKDFKKKNKVKIAKVKKTLEDIFAEINIQIKK